MKTTKYKAVWLEFPAGNRNYGAGGWSRRAKCRPAPERREIITSDVILTSGKSVIVAGQRKLKLNLFKATTGEVVRADYPVDGLTEFGLTPRQIAARERVRAKKAAAAAAIQAEYDAEIAKIKAAQRAELIANMPQDVRGWIAAGCHHPAPPAVIAAKKSSGLSWTKFCGSQNAENYLTERTNSNGEPKFEPRETPGFKT